MIAPYVVITHAEYQQVSAWGLSSNTVYLDIFSCRWYNVEEAVKFARTFFKGSSVHVQRCLRR